MTAEPDEVVKGICLLRAAEKVPDPEHRAKRISEAFAPLNAYLAENASSEHREYIENCKRAYMKTHLERLAESDEPDSLTWLSNALLFVVSKPEVDQVLNDFPQLRPWYDRFMESGRERARSEFGPWLPSYDERSRAILQLLLGLTDDLEGNVEAADS